LKRILPKSFWMMKLLNRDYPAPLRALSALMAFGLVIFSTGRPSLARELAGRCWVHNDYKVAVRRAAWYMRRGWLNIDVVEDDFFDATEGMDDGQLVSLEAFVQARKSKLAADIYAGDLATIAARRLNNNSDPEQRQKNIDSFEAACNELLKQKPKTIDTPHKPDSIRAGDFPIENAKITLTDFATLFPLGTMRWFFVSGTFLGLIRENGFLAHDYDIDLGVFEDEIDIPAVLAEIEASDCFVLKKYDHHQSTLFAPKTAAQNPDVPYILKLVHVTGIHIDLFIHYHDTTTDPGIDWHGSSLHRWENTTFDVVPYQFYDQTVLGPADADRYLTENYGDWRTPVTQFNCTTDTPNLVLVPHPIAIAIFLRRYVRARQTDQQYAQKLEEELMQNGFLIRTPDNGMTFSGDLFCA
jgi:hypothetical protein